MRLNPAGLERVKSALKVMLLVLALWGLTWLGYIFVYDPSPQAVESIKQIFLVFCFSCLCVIVMSYFFD